MSADKLRVAEVAEAAWRNALDLDIIEPDANFFALGGDSLTAMSLLAAIQDEANILATFSDILEAPVFCDFVERLSGLKRRSAAQKRQKRQNSSAPMTIVQLDRWRKRRQSPGGAEVYWAYEIDGPLKVDVLSQAVDELVKRHEILRTTFRRRRGRPRQVVEPFRPGWLRVVDTTAGPTKQSKPTVALQRLVDEDYRTFDYEHGPLIRATLVILGSRRYLFSIACSEMVMDGSSRRILNTGLSTLYSLLDREGNADDYPYPPLQFGDFAAERKALVSRARYSEQVLYWRAKLRSIEPAVAFRGYELSPEFDANAGVATRSAQLNPTFIDAVRRTSQALSTSMFSVLTSAFVVVLHALCGTDDPAFTTTLAHRDVPGADQLIGAFYNNLLLSVSLDGVHTAEDLVAATGIAIKEAFLNGEVPLPQALRFGKRSPSPHLTIPTSSIRFQLHGDPGEIRLPGVTLRKVTLPIRPLIHLYLAATETSSRGLDLYLGCRPDIPGPILNNLLPAYRRVLQAITANTGVPLPDLLRAASISSYASGAYARTRST